jgi:hypothetical protein
VLLFWGDDGELARSAKSEVTTTTLRAGASASWNPFIGEFSSSHHRISSPHHLTPSSPLTSSHLLSGAAAEESCTVKGSPTADHQVREPPCPPRS